MKELNLDLFFWTASERHRIYTLKEFGIEKPWTHDEIFRNSYFCNVFRDVDKVSRWIITHVMEKYSDHPNLWKAIILSRVISRISTLEKLEKYDALIHNYKDAYEILREMQSNGEPIVTGAFIINSGPYDKVSYIFRMLMAFDNLIVEGIPFGDWIETNNSLQESVKTLKRVYGIANFMAYQYTCDFTYTRYLKYANDLYSYVMLGLGAVRGMNRLVNGSPSSNKIPEGIEYAKRILYEWNNYVHHNLNYEMQKTYNLIKDKRKDTTKDYGELISYVEKSYRHFKDLKLQDVQHWLCEYDKYCRGGSSKRRYKGS